MEQKEKDKTDVVYEAVVYRRDEDDKLMILFTQAQGRGRQGLPAHRQEPVDATTRRSGKWERRTERERIGGTDSPRGDFDESRLAEEYDADLRRRGEAGRSTSVHRIKLKAKPGRRRGLSRRCELWVDQATGNVLKRQEFALSGRLMRTAYYPSWKKLFSESKKADVWYPEEMRFYDEVEKANQTLVLIKSVDLRPLDANLFTKAWLESKSR